MNTHVYLLPIQRQHCPAGVEKEEEEEEEEKEEEKEEEEEEEKEEEEEEEEEEEGGGGCTIKNYTRNSNVPQFYTSNRAKAEVLAALYGRLNLNLVRANATAILSRCFVPDY